MKNASPNGDSTIRIGAATRPGKIQYALDNTMGKVLIGAEMDAKMTIEGPTCPIEFSALDTGRGDDRQ